MYIQSPHKGKGLLELEFRGPPILGACWNEFVFFLNFYRNTTFIMLNCIL